MKIGDVMKWTALIGLLLFLSVGTSFAQSYSITEINNGLTGAAYLSPGELNDSGQVVGYNIATQRAFLWDNGNYVDLGQQYYDQCLSEGWGYGSNNAYAINNAGVAVGYANLPYPSYTTRALMWQGGNVFDIGTPGTDAKAYDINNSNQVIISENGSYFLWSAGQSISLGLSASAINDNGQVIGLISSGSSTRAALWSNGIITDLGSFGNGSGIAFAHDINDLGYVVGESSYATSGFPLPGAGAFLWKDGQMVELGALSGQKVSAALAINESNQIVGYSAYKAALWSLDGEVIDLNTLIALDSGWILQNAYDINENGQIVGVGTYNGQTRGFLLTPTLNPVPELSTFWQLILAGGVVGLVYLRSYSKKVERQSK